MQELLKDATEMLLTSNSIDMLVKKAPDPQSNQALKTLKSLNLWLFSLI